MMKADVSGGRRSCGALRARLHPQDSVSRDRALNDLFGSISASDATANLEGLDFTDERHLEDAKSLAQERSSRSRSTGLMRKQPSNNVQRIYTEWR